MPSEVLAGLRTAGAVTLEGGGAPARRRAAAVDEQLAALVAGAGPRLAVVAVGGYGRGELSPHSDIDLLLLVTGEPGGDGALRGLLYPLWDAGFRVGHAVRTPLAAVEHARGDPHAATALLSARFVAGDRELYEDLLAHRRRWLRAEARALARLVLDGVAERHRRVERAGWVLAPDLKEDVGALRDLHALGWLEALAGTVGKRHAKLVAAGELLLAVREALHATVPRKLDRLRIDLQPKVARILGIGGDADGQGLDRLMAAVHTAARTVEHLTAVERQELAEQLLGGPRRSGTARRLRHGVLLQDGLLAAEEPAPEQRLGAALRVLAAHARTGRPPARGTLAWMARAFERPPLEAWDAELRGAFLDLLAGAHVVSACELLDHLGGWPVLLPEWAGIRGRAQHDPYHRYTVDGHLFATVGEAGRLVRSDEPAGAAAREAGAPESLYLAALLHDVGKGGEGDHSAAGERLARRALRRMGLPPSQVEEVACLVRWHLLLVDTATRRDTNDPAVVATVVDRVLTARRLRLLWALTVADGRATGPHAWNDWRAALVAELYRRAEHACRTGELPGARRDLLARRARELEAVEPALAGRAEPLLTTFPPSYLVATPLAAMASELTLLLDPPGPGGVRCLVEEGGGGTAGTVVTVCTLDQPGTLARTAGVLALHRMPVLHAEAWSTSAGLALERFVVQPPERPRWERVRADLEAAYSGRLALEARLERKAREYHRPGTAPPEVAVIPDASEHATVVEVRATDALGLLYCIAAALSDLGLDIRVAKIDTQGDRVVDVFYVRTPWDAKLDEGHAAEVRLAITHRVARFLGTDRR